MHAPLLLCGVIFDFYDGIALLLTLFVKLFVVVMQRMTKGTF
jgi:hypothetical protein